MVRCQIFSLASMFTADHNLLSSLPPEIGNISTLTQLYGQTIFTNLYQCGQFLTTCCGHYLKKSETFQNSPSCMMGQHSSTSLTDSEFQQVEFIGNLSKLARLSGELTTFKRQ